MKLGRDASRERWAGFRWRSSGARRSYATSAQAGGLRIARILSRWARSESRTLIGGVADGVETAGIAFGRSRHAEGAAVEDDLVREADPAVLGNDFDEILLDLDGVGVFGEVEAPGDALDVGIDDDS